MISDVCRQNLLHGGGLDIDDGNRIRLLQGHECLAVLGGDVLRLEVDGRLGLVCGRAEDAHALREILAVKGLKVSNAGISLGWGFDALWQLDNGHRALWILDVVSALSVELVGGLTLVGHKGVAPIGSDMDVIRKSADGHAAQLCGLQVLSRDVEEQRFAFLGLVGLLNGGDSQTVRANGNRVDLFAFACGNRADAGEGCRVGSIENINLTGMSIDGEDALGCWVEGHDFGSGLLVYPRLVSANRGHLEAGVGNRVLDHAIHNLGGSCWDSQADGGSGCNAQGKGAAGDRARHSGRLLVMRRKDSELRYVPLCTALRNRT